MRELKFRQAIYKDGKFHHWHYWGYVGHNGAFVAPIEISQDSSPSSYEVKESQSYTGRHTGPLELGPALYEGDIVRDFHGNILQVCWADCWARYMMSYDGKTCQYYLEDYNNNKPDCLAKNMELIGSIHETPELIPRLGGK